MKWMQNNLFCKWWAHFMEPNNDEENCLGIFYFVFSPNMNILVHNTLQIGFQLGHWHWCCPFSYVEDLGKDILPPTYRKALIVSWAIFVSFPSKTLSGKPLQIYISWEINKHFAMWIPNVLPLNSVEASWFSMCSAQKEPILSTLSFYTQSWLLHISTSCQWRGQPHRTCIYKSEVRRGRKVIIPLSLALGKQYLVNGIQRCFPP